MLAIPPNLLDILGLSAGNPVNMMTDGQRVIIEAISQPKYKLDELLALCDPSVQHSKEELQWLSHHSHNKANI